MLMTMQRSAIPVTASTVGEQLYQRLHSIWLESEHQKDKNHGTTRCRSRNSRLQYHHFRDAIRDTVVNQFSYYLHVGNLLLIKCPSEEDMDNQIKAAYSTFCRLVKGLLEQRPH